MDESLSQAVARLINVLEEEASLLASLNKLLKREKEVLLRFAPRELELLTAQKESLCLGQRALEEEHIRAIKNVACLLQPPPVKLAIPELADRVGGKEGERLQALKVRLRSLGESIQELNRLNRGFIEHSLQCLRATASLMGGLFSTSSIYGSGGRLNQVYAPLSTYNGTG